MKISVVTPVYNAGPFLRRAVESAVSQPEVGEVILVEDASTDDSLDVCKALTAEFQKVRLVRHPDGKNHGAGRTRNLGIKEARFEYLAFSDADNFYLPGRFAVDRQLVESDPTLDGVYSAQGVHYYSDKARELFYAAGMADAGFLSISGPVPPDQFCAVMLGSHPHVGVIGGLGIDAITLRKAAIEKIGLFDPTLRLQQDVHFFIRMAATCKMASGVLDRPVAVRGVHEHMRSTDPNVMAEYRRQCWTSLRGWFRTNVSDRGISDAFDRAFFQRQLSWASPWTKRWSFAALILRQPGLVRHEYGFFDLNLLACFGRNSLTLHALSLKNRVIRTARRRRKSYGSGMHSH